MFLDALREEFEGLKKLSRAGRRDKLAAFHDKIAGLKFLNFPWPNPTDKQRAA
jgi:hypothetical protein